MDNPYRDLFEAPEAKAFVLAGLLARLALPMTGIGIITMLSQLRDSYSLAGAVAATVVLTYALLSPQVSRLVDQHGQGRVLPYASLISVLGMLCLLAASWWQAPDWTLFLSAVLVGCIQACLPWFAHGGPFCTKDSRVCKQPMHWKPFLMRLASLSGHLYPLDFQSQHFRRLVCLLRRCCTARHVCIDRTAQYRASD